MNRLFKSESLIASFRFLARTVLCFFVIKYFFLAYTGLTIEGGSLYSRFLAEHFDIIGLFRRFLLWGGTMFTSLIGYPSYHSDYLLKIQGGSGVNLVYSCLGFDLIAAYLALVVGWPSKRLFQVVSGLMGTAIIIFLNMIRLGGLAVLYTTRNYRLFEYINHHDLFNIVVLSVTLIMFAVHVRYTERHTAKID